MFSAFHRSKSALRAGAAALALIAAGAALPGLVAPAHSEAVRVEGVQAPGFADVVEQVQPAVVSVRVKTRIDNASLDGLEEGPSANPRDEFFRRFFREFGPGAEQDQRRPREHGEGRNGPREQRRGAMSQGSGFFISEDGYVVTNNHVVENGAEFTIVMNDGEELDAKLIGTDPRTDLALLKVDDARKFTYVGFADDAAVRVGDWVVAIGNPFGLGGTVTAGIVSGLGRDIGAGPYSDFIQIDAAVNRGNSGGPAFNLKGEVVGVNTAIFSPSGGNVGIAFAIPASTTRSVIDDLRQNGNVTRGFIGVRIQPLTDDLAESLGLKNADGALVASVIPDGPAAKAGIEPGDVITDVDGRAVANPRELTRAIGAIEPGKSAELRILRDGKQESLKLELGKLEPEKQAEAPAAPDEGKTRPASVDALGFDVVPNDAGEGLVVTKVNPGSPAAERGIEPGDVIVEINGNAIAAVEDVTKALDAAKSDNRKSVLMRVTRDENARFLALPMDRG